MTLVSDPEAVQAAVIDAAAGLAIETLQLAKANEFSEILAEGKRLEQRTQAATAAAQSRVNAIFDEALQYAKEHPSAAPQAFLRAGERSQDALIDAWRNSAEAAHTSAVNQARLLALKGNIPDSPRSSSFLISVLDDVDLIGDQTAQLALEALQHGDISGLENAVRRAKHRASAAAGVIPTRAATDTSALAISALAEQNPGAHLVKVWVATLSLNTCGDCAALHGQIVDIDAEFSHEITFATTPKKVHGTLPGPPRHPHCHCRLVPYADTVSIKGGFSPSTLRKQGQNFAARKASMSPRSWQTQDLSDLARTTNFMTASDVRKIPEAKWTMVKEAFLSCVIKFKNVAK